MTASVILSDTFGDFKDKANELIVMTQAGGMLSGNPIKLQDSTQSTSNTTGSIITAGGVGIAKDVIVGGSVNVHGNLHANGNITSDGSLTFGDAATDNVVFAADINSHIIPNTDDTYDLGSTGQQWRNLYLNGTANLDIVDIDGAVQIDAAVTVGVDGTGQDVKFFGDTASQYMLWDQSGDELVLTLDGKLSFWDAAGGENILATSDGHLEVNAGTTLDITAPTVDINASTLIQVDGEVKVGVAGTGNDVYFYGDTAAKYLLWDQSGDELALINATKLSFWDAAGGENIVAASDGNLGINAGTALTITSPDITIADGSVDFDIASHDGTNGLKLGGTLVTATAADLNSVKQFGKETIWVPALAMRPTESNGCSTIQRVETTSGRPDMDVLDFDKDGDEFAQFSVAFPKSWNLGTITFKCYWSGIAATTGVSWAVQGVAMNDNETIDVAFGTAVVVDDSAQGAVEELLVTAESGAVTIAGTPADDDLTYFRVYRDVSDSNDDMAGDARLHGIKIFFTTDAANDA